MRKEGLRGKLMEMDVQRSETEKEGKREKGERSRTELKRQRSRGGRMGERWRVTETTGPKKGGKCRI